MWQIYEIFKSSSSAITLNLIRSSCFCSSFFANNSEKWNEKIFYALDNEQISFSNKVQRFQLFQLVSFPIASSLRLKSPKSLHKMAPAKNTNYIFTPNKIRKYSELLTFYSNFRWYNPFLRKNIHFKPKKSRFPSVWMNRLRTRRYFSNIWLKRNVFVFLFFFLNKEYSNRVSQTDVSKSICLFRSWKIQKCHWYSEKVVVFGCFRCNRRAMFRNWAKFSDSE